MDFDDTCYCVDVIDNFVSKYVQDTFIKDKLSELLQDEPPEVDAHDDFVEEECHQDMVVAGMSLH